MHKEFNSKNYEQNSYRHNSFGSAELLPVACATIVIVVLGGLTRGGETTDYLSVGQFLLLFNTTLSFGRSRQTRWQPP